MAEKKSPLETNEGEFSCSDLNGIEECSYCGHYHHKGDCYRVQIEELMEEMSSLTSVIKKLAKAHITTMATSKQPPYAPAAIQYEPPKYAEANPQQNYAIFVEHLPDMMLHFQKLALILGYTLDARFYGEAVQFLPKTHNEDKTIKNYLQKLKETEPNITWESNTPFDELPPKIIIKGLPSGFSTSEIKKSLKDEGLSVKSVEAVPEEGSLDYVYTVELDYLAENQLTKVFSYEWLCNVPSITNYVLKQLLAQHDITEVPNDPLEMEQLMKEVVQTTFTEDDKLKENEGETGTEKKRRKRRGKKAGKKRENSLVFFTPTETTKTIPIKRREVDISVCF